MRETTPYVTGLPQIKGGSGDPSPVTALGVFRGIEACAEEAWGSRSLDGRTVAVQGIGHVGFHLCKRLREAGAQLVVTDVNQQRVDEAARELEATVVPPQEIYDVDCDIFAPCALGAILNERSIPILKCKIVAGAANNQLAEERHGEDLLSRGIIYAPDFVINAGGIINVSVEFLEGGYDEAVSTKRVKNIYQAIKDILRTGKEQGIPTSQAAIVLAQEILADGRRKKEGSGPEF